MPWPWNLAKIPKLFWTGQLIFIQFERFCWNSFHKNAKITCQTKRSQTNDTTTNQKKRWRRTGQWKKCQKSQATFYYAPVNAILKCLNESCSLLAIHLTNLRNGSHKTDFCQLPDGVPKMHANPSARKASPSHTGCSKETPFQSNNKEKTTLTVTHTETSINLQV